MCQLIPAAQLVDDARRILKPEVLAIPGATRPDLGDVIQVAPDTKRNARPFQRLRLRDGAGIPIGWFGFTGRTFHDPKDREPAVG